MGEKSKNLLVIAKHYLKTDSDGLRVLIVALCFVFLPTVGIAESLNDRISRIGAMSVADEIIQCGSLMIVWYGLASESTPDGDHSGIRKAATGYLGLAMGVFSGKTELTENEAKERISRVEDKYIEIHSKGLAEDFDAHIDSWNYICEQYYPAAINMAEQMGVE